MRIVVCLCSCGWRVSGTKTSKSSEISQLPVQNPFRAQRKTQRQETMRIVVFLNFVSLKKIKYEQIFSYIQFCCMILLFLIKNK